MVVSLALHKTNRAHRAAKDIRKQIRDCVNGAQQNFGTGIAGYALVIWSEDGRSISNWDGADALGGYPVEEFARYVIGRSKAKLDAKDVVFGPEDDEG